MAWDPGRASGAGRLVLWARLVRVEHTLFSLPFAYAGAVLACPQCLGLREAVLIGLAVFGLRTAAMAYNAVADVDVDAANPRTRGRPLVQGVVGAGEAMALVLAGTLVYIVSAWLLNMLALLLSPLLWVAAMSYPYAKRLHSLPHLHLGLVLSTVVFGGTVAVAGDAVDGLAGLVGLVPWVYMAAILMWVAGFDTLYALMDEEFDRRMGLGSIPASLGQRGARLVSLAMHAAASALLAVSVPLYGLGAASAATIAAAITLMAYQHVVVARRGVEAVPKAFNANLAIAPLVTLGILADKLVSP